MRISELRKIVREIVRNSVKESVFDDKGLERAGTGLPQTEEEPIENPIEEGHSCGCNEVHDCGCGGHHPISESTNPREKALLDTFNNIVKTHSALKVKDGGKTTLVDVQSANVVLKLYDALSDKNKESLFKMPIPQMIKMAWHVMGKAR